MSLRPYLLPEFASKKGVSDTSRQESQVQIPVKPPSLLGMLRQLRPFLRSFRYVSAYMRFMHIYIGVRAGLFDLLATKTSLDDFVRSHDFDRELLSIWLKIAAQQGLVREAPEGYTLTKKGSTFTSNSQTYASTFVLLQVDYWAEAFHKIPELLKTHARITTQGRGFETLVANLSRSIETLSFRILRKLPQSKKQGSRFLDVGCGLGTYLIYLAKMNPTLQGVGVELAEDVATSAKELVAKEGLAERIRIIQGDAREVEFDGSFDLCNFSQIYYYLSPSEKVSLFRKIRDHLNENGALAILVPVLSKNQRSRADFFPLFFHLFQRTQTNLYGIPTKQEIYQTLRDAGFTQIRTRRLAPIGLPYYYILGTRTS